MGSLTYNSRAGAAVSAASIVHHLLNLPNSKPTQFSKLCKAEGADYGDIQLLESMVGPLLY